MQANVAPDVDYTKCVPICVIPIKWSRRQEPMERFAVLLYQLVSAYCMMRAKCEKSNCANIFNARFFTLRYGVVYGGDESMAAEVCLPTNTLGHL